LGLPTLSLVDLLHATGGGFPFLFVAASVGLFILPGLWFLPPGRLVSLKFGDEIRRTER